MAPGDNVNLGLPWYDIFRVDETRLVRTADHTLVVSDYLPTGIAESAWSPQTDGAINADNSINADN